MYIFLQFDGFWDMNVLKLILGQVIKISPFHVSHSWALIIGGVGPNKYAFIAQMFNLYLCYQV